VRAFPYAGVAVFTYLSALRFTPHDTVRGGDLKETFCRGVAGSVAGVTGQLVTYPLDVVRARMTIYPGQSSGMLACAQRIVRESGARGLYAGVGPTLATVAPFFAVQMVTADVLKSELAGRDVEVTSPVMFAVGAAAGAAAQTVVYPLDLVRRRMQLAGSTQTHPATPLSFRGTLRDALTDRGVRGLFTGIGVAYVKVIPSVAVAMGCSKALIDAYTRW
jgi:hypothetical protein